MIHLVWKKLFPAMIQNNIQLYTFHTLKYTISKMLFLN